MKSLATDLYKESALTHFKAMQTFMAKNVFDFLFTPATVYKVGCAVNDDDGCRGWTEFLPLKQYDHRLTLRMLDQGETFANLTGYVCGESIYSCDWCSMGIRDYDFVFCCRNKHTEQHYYCTFCVSEIITLNRQLKNLLVPLLEEDLIDDCIQAISDFVVGNVAECR